MFIFVNISKLNPKSNVESPFPNALGKGRGWGRKKPVLSSAAEVQLGAGAHDAARKDTL